MLITRTDRIGDFVQALPVFEAVCKQLNIEFTVLCQDTVLPILENNPFVKSVIAINSGDSIDKTISEINPYKFDALLVLVNDPITTNLLPYLKSIPIKIGPLNKPKALIHYSHPALQKRSRSLQNEAEYNLKLLKIFDPNINVQIKPKVYVGSAEKALLKKAFVTIQFDKRKTIIFHSGMSGSALNWNFKYYQELFSKLAELDVNIILTGYSEIEEKRNDILLKQLRFQNFVYNLTGKLTLRDLIVLHSLSDVFIGPSTGPTHIANACGLKIFSFYPPIQVQSKQRWQPYLADSIIFTPRARCGQKYKCIREKCPEFYCMDQISVSEVYGSIYAEIMN